MKDDQVQTSKEARQLIPIGTSIGNVTYEMLYLHHASQVLSLLSIEVHEDNPNTWEVELEESGLQGIHQPSSHQGLPMSTTYKDALFLGKQQWREWLSLPIVLD